MSTRYVVLLRGINLGPNRRIPMKGLREALGARDFESVRTHLASGNVVLDSPLPEGELGPAVTQAIEQEFGIDVPVMVRTGRELDDVVSTDPFGGVVTDPSRYSVTFLPEPPAPERVADLPAAEGGEYSVVGRELYLWLPDGMGRSAMARWNWDRLLGVPGTNRNWNTVTALAELAR